MSWRSFLAGVLIGALLVGGGLFVVNSGFVETAAGTFVFLFIGAVGLMLVGLVGAMCLAAVGWLRIIPAKLRRLWSWMAMKPHVRKPLPPHQLN